MKYQVFVIGLCGMLAACAPRVQDASEFRGESSAFQIVNGERVQFRDSRVSKAVVALLANGPQGMFTFCTATLVASDVVVTAAHCFDPRLHRNEVLTYDIGLETNVFVVHSKIPVKGYAVFSKYNSTGFYDNDIAVAVLEKPVPAEFEPVPLDRNVQADYSNKKITVFGFGRGEDYKGSTTINAWETIGFLRTGIFSIDDNYNKMPDRYFLKSGQKKFICQGDSGGPSFMTLHGQPTLVGVNSASFGTRLADGGRACDGWAQMTKVAPFAPWIDENVQRLR